MNELLSIKNVSISYGSRTILQDVSFEIKPKEIVALLGKNGCGKSTLLSAIAGMKDFSGICSLEGKNISTLKPKYKATKIGYLSQSYENALNLPAIEIILMGYNPVLGLLENPSKEHRKNAIKMAEYLAIQDYLYQDFSTLSQGQRQMILFARTLINQPKVLILDEPDSALDYSNRYVILQKLKQYAQQTNAGILLCSHDINITLRYADRIILLKDGEVFHTLIPTQMDSIQMTDILQQVYGKIEVFQHKGYFMMTKEGSS